MAEIQDQEQLKSDVTMASTEEDEESAEDILQEMYEKELISHAVVPKWQEFGIQLGFSYGELGTFNKDAEDKANEDCALQMLGEWRTTPNATPDKLIRALQAIDKNRYASQLQKALDKGTFDKDYPDNKIAKSIAPYWDDVGIHLRVKNSANIRKINDPTKHRFKNMLRKWIGKQTCSKHEIWKKYHEALVGIELIADAEKFEEKLKPDDADGNGDDDEPCEVPN